MGALVHGRRAYAMGDVFEASDATCCQNDNYLREGL